MFEPTHFGFGSGSHASWREPRSGAHTKEDTRKSITLTGLAAGLAMIPAAAFAQEAEDLIVDAQDSAELRSEWLLGARIVSPENEAIGPIRDIIIDQEDGSVEAVIVSVGGFLGFGSKEIAVDWSELDISYDANVVSLALPREEAEAAQGYVYREREFEPVPADNGAGTGTGTGMDSGTGMGTGTSGLD